MIHYLFMKEFAGLRRSHVFACIYFIYFFIFIIRVFINNLKLHLLLIYSKNISSLI